MQTLLIKASILGQFADLFSNFGEIKWQMVLMWAVGGLLVYLAIAKEMEPTLLLPMGFGTILVNLPWSGAITQPGAEEGPIDVLFNAGIANELFPLLLFIGIGAMIDFGPLLKNPWLMLFGAAAQFGIFFTFFVASFFFDINDAASIAIIGAADGPTSIFVANELNSKYLGAIMVAAYSYMALVPIVQPPVIKAVTTKKERLIRMKYSAGDVSKTTKILSRRCNRYSRTRCTEIGSTRRLSYVRQPNQGMRRTQQPFRNGTKFIRQHYHDFARNHRIGSNELQILCSVGYDSYSFPRTDSICI